MAVARANWKGYLRLSLVSCPVALYPATSDEKKISLNRINRATGNRLRQQNIDEVTKEVITGEDVGKAYQLDKETRIPIEDEELEAIELESKRTIQIEQFVPAEDIDQRFIVRPYYLVPDGEAGEEAYAVIRDAMKEENVVGVGKVMLSSREHMIALYPSGKGIVGNLLRYPAEVRSEKDYFEEVPHVEVADDMLDMAKTLIKKYEGKFDPSAFKDRYGDALRALIELKKGGKKIIKTDDLRSGAATNVVNLMDLLRKSVKGEGSAEGTRRPAPARGATSSKKARDSQAFHVARKTENGLMATVIKIKCLVCGHVGQIAEDDLPDYGFRPDAAIALISKRLKCRECGSRAMSAQRQASTERQQNGGNHLRPSDTVGARDTWDRLRVGRWLRRLR